MSEYFIIVSILIALFYSGGAFAVSGRDVVFVQYNDTGVFRKTTVLNWIEGDTQGNINFNYIELARDEWSVYLFDPSRNARIELNIWTRKVLFADDNTPIHDQYDIKLVNNFTLDINNPVVSGNNVVSVQHINDGSYENIFDLHWVEKTRDGEVINRFVETHRDQWTVYLLDSAREVRIQLDLWRKKVRYSDNETPIRDLYDIIWANS